MFLELVEKNKQLHVLLALAKSNFLILNFDFGCQKVLVTYFPLWLILLEVD